MIRFILLIITLFIFIILNSFDPFVFISTLLVIMSIHIKLYFRSNLSFYFLLFPLISIFLSFFYVQDYITLGDGEAYFNLASDFYEKFFTEVKVNFLEDFEKTFLLATYLGAFPQIIITQEIFTSNINSEVFYLSQQLFFIILLSVLTAINSFLKILSEDKMLYIILFLLLSPTFFAFGTGPTRHYFTFFSLFLFYLSIESLLKKFSYSALFLFILAIAFTALTKGGYLFLYLIYIVFRITSNKRSIKSIFLFIISLLFITLYFYFYDYFIKFLFPSNEQIYNTGNSVKLQGPAALIYKIIVTSFGNFPWYNFKIHYNNFGGNIILFFFQILSSITWLIILSELVFTKGKLNFILKKENTILLFGIVMMISFLFGKIGHHGYLSIFFPFLVSILNKKSLRFIPGIIAFCFLLNIVHALNY